LSYELTQRAFDLVDERLTAAEKLVLIALARYANDMGGSCYPTVKTIAERAALTDRHVRSSIHRLADLGYVWIECKTGRANCYSLAPDMLPLPDFDPGTQFRSEVNSVQVRGELSSEAPELTSGGPELTSGHSKSYMKSFTKPESIQGQTGVSPDTDSEVDSGPQSQPFADDFAILWAIYPRKIRRKAAYQAYVARRRAKTDPADLLAATENYAKVVSGKEPEFILHGSTFFNKDRWWDYLDDGASLTEQPASATDRMAAALAKRYGEA
jgi:hypothetical protein